MQKYSFSLRCYSCQFIVQESGDYKQYMNNPDALVKWDLIEQVVRVISGLEEN